MPIEGGSPAECFEHFRAHVAQLVATILSDVPPVLVVQSGGTRATMSFPDPQTMRLQTAVGELQLYLGQALEAYTREGGAKRFTLRTNAYWYRLHWADEGELLRWEYVREHRPEGPNFPRNHVHIHGTVTTPRGTTLVLQKFHIPTGWTTIEGIIRFLITDLSVAPLTEEWPRLLMESERLFRNEFVPRGPWPPADP